MGDVVYIANEHSRPRDGSVLPHIARVDRIFRLKAGDSPVNAGGARKRRRSDDAPGSIDRRSPDGGAEARLAQQDGTLDDSEANPRAGAGDSVGTGAAGGGGVVNADNIPGSSAAGKTPGGAASRAGGGSGTASAAAGSTAFAASGALNSAAAGGSGGASSSAAPSGATEPFTDLDNGLLLDVTYFYRRSDISSAVLRRSAISMLKDPGTLYIILRTSALVSGIVCSATICPAERVGDRLSVRHGSQACLQLLNCVAGGIITVAVERPSQWELFYVISK